jgi:TolB-like protein/Flp pilus assembly protein TadD
MATVHLAEDVKHRRKVAVKVLHPHLAAHMGSDRFLREIEIAAQLSHPHILTLIDSGAAEALLYFVMPYVEGESLRQRLDREKSLPIAVALRIAREVASALSYAHARGIVHRDIKPENVMLHEGGAFVTDFGIARAVSAAGDSLTQTGVALGTPAYMSPEQAAGERELDARSDIYSLGCVIYEMLAGEAPFRGPNAQAVMMRRFTESPAPVRAARPDVPDAVDAAVGRALARDPADRFGSAAELTAALEPAMGPAAPPDAPRSVAVLPFADMSPERDQEYFGDGIAEEIISALTRIDALRVAARTSSFAFKGKNEDIGSIGARLKVGAVVEGSIRKAGKRLRVTAQLVNVADGFQLWSERYDRDLEDVFAIQDEIAANIVQALRVVLSSEAKRAIGRPRTDHIAAYEHYLRGRQYLHQFREKSLKFARRMFERAIEIDPRYMLAYAGLADCSAFLYMYHDASDANRQQADSASLRALELGPDVAEAHASRGLALTLLRDDESAAREFETAIRLDPRLFEAHYFYGRACLQRGANEEAARHFGDASAVRPEDYQSPSLQAQALEALGRVEEARATRHRASQIAAHHLELHPDDARALYLGAADLASLGQREKSLEWVARALAIDPEDTGVLYNVGCAYAILGEPDRAMDCIEKAVENGFGHREWIEQDGDLDVLRGLPRFQQLLRRL